MDNCIQKFWEFVEGNCAVEFQILKFHKFLSAWSHCSDIRQVVLVMHHLLFCCFITTTI